MKTLFTGLVILGFLLLLGALLVKFFGHPHVFMGVKSLSMVSLANTAFLLAIITKICEQKVK